MKGHRDRDSGLTASEERFCLQLIKPGVSQADAYRYAFPKSLKWSDKTAWEKASRLAAEDKVLARVRGLRDQVTAAGIIDAVEVKLLLSRVARADVRKCYREDGTLKAPHEIDDETAAGILGFETVEEFRGKGKDGKRVAIVRKVKLINRVEALDKLMRHYGQYEKDNMQQPANPWKEILDLIDGTPRGLPSMEKV